MVGAPDRNDGRLRDVTPRNPQVGYIAAFLMFEGIALLSITVAAITDFCRSAQSEHDEAVAPTDDGAAVRIEARLDDLAQRLDRLNAVSERLDRV